MAWLKNAVCGVVLLVMALVSALNTVLARHVRGLPGVLARASARSARPILGTVIDDEDFTCRPRLCEGASTAR